MPELMDRLERQLSHLLGRRIQDALLLVWPESGDEETDTQLHLKLDGGEELTIRTAPDGQTPLIETERVEPMYRWKNLPERRKVWQAHGFWDDSREKGYEAFVVDELSQLSILLTATIVGVAIVCIGSEEDLAPIGIRLNLDNGAAVYSAAGTYGNALSLEAPHYEFDKGLTEIEVRPDLSQ